MNEKGVKITKEMPVQEGVGLLNIQLNSLVTVFVSIANSLKRIEIFLGIPKEIVLKK